MKKRNYKKVFYDDGTRWKRVKRLSFISTVFIVLLISVFIYSFIYTPFTSTLTKSGNDAIYKSVENIVNNDRPIINQGTFLEVKNVYGEDYVWRFGEDSKYVVLSFDDGPDPKYTPQILDILNREGVKGSFFALGNKLYKYPEVGQQILDQGSDLGVHTFTHHAIGDDGVISNLRFILELDFTEKIYAKNYGYKTNLFRVPYQGVEDMPPYYALQYIREAKKRGMEISAPTVDSDDWEEKDVNKIIANSTNPEVMGAVILFHDSGGDRSRTVKALPSIIKFYKQKGYTFTTVSELAKKNNIPVTKQLSTRDKILVPISYHTYDTFKKTPAFLKKVFVTGLFLLIIHMFIFILLAISHVVKEGRIKKARLKKFKPDIKTPLVTVLVPMFNEENSIKGSIRSILNSTYKNYEILVIDDGSTDNSLQLANSIKDFKLRVYSKPNGGKFSALNYGIRFARGKILVCLDADTRVRSNAISEIVNEFADRKVAAVAGNIKVGNRVNRLTKIQFIEYILAHSIEKRSLDLFSSVMVVPGAFGAWRTNTIKRMGGFSPRTLAEDFDLTLKLMKKKYKVAFSDSAIAYTEAPSSVRQLYNQRRRWTYGNLQVLFRHRGMILNKNYGALGLFFMPRTVLLQIPMIILTPIVDIFVITNLLFGERTLTLWFIGFYFLIQYTLIIIAFKISKEKVSDLRLVPFLRFPYAQFIYLIFFESIFKILRGEASEWRLVHHSGKFTLKRQSKTVSRLGSFAFLNKFL